MTNIFWEEGVELKHWFYPIENSTWERAKCTSEENIGNFEKP